MPKPIKAGLKEMAAIIPMKKGANMGCKGKGGKKK